MAVSKRLRFEILRRDNHTCRYCGASAPDVPLRVDHVTPEALGGRTEPANLVTACEPCNSGKSSVALDSTTVEDIKADALRFAEVTRQAYAVRAERVQERTDYEDEWYSVWSEAGRYRRAGLPPDWRNTLGRWHGMGVPIGLVEDAARVALRDLRTADPFRYFCGIVWNQVQVVTAEAHGDSEWREHAMDLGHLVRAHVPPSVLVEYFIDGRLDQLDFLKADA